MPRKFRLTCARTTYFDVEVTADDGAEAERLLEAAIATNPALCDSSRLIGKSIHRIVEIAAQEEEGASAGGLRESHLAGGANEEPAVSERQL
ncbi:MAG: hypothetical protein ACLQJR_12540, partial [Stellaceae bacterium]